MTTRTGAQTEIDPKILDRVRALLAKAESTSFPEEAAAFTAKAQALMARHAIDQALIQSHDNAGQITSVRLHIPAPYAKNKVRLLSAVARPNRCRVITGLTPEDRQHFDWRSFAALGDGLPANIFGYPADIEIVEMLFTSLLLQATNAMLQRGSVINEWGQNETRSFRHSFLLGFAESTRERLQEVQDLASDAADAKFGGALLPVLASRSEQVDRRVDEVFPNLKFGRGTSYSNVDGFSAGHHAGQRADVGNTRLGSRTALPH